MADTETVKSKRDLALLRLKGRYPDEQFDDDEQVFGRINDDYDQYDKELGEYREREGKFADMFSKNPHAARLMMEWKNGEDPVVVLMRMYGDELKEALDDPEKQKKIAEANREYMEQASKEKEYAEQWKTNIAQSLDDLNQLQKDEGVSDEQVDSALEWLFTTAKDIMLGKISIEAIKLAVKAQNYDNDVEQAGAEGEVRGKNTKITEQLRKQSQGDGMANLGGKNGAGQQRKPVPDLGAIDRYSDGNMSIFERGGEKRTPVKR